MSVSSKSRHVLQVWTYLALPLQQHSAHFALLGIGACGVAQTIGLQGVGTCRPTEKTGSHEINSKRWASFFLALYGAFCSAGQSNCGGESGVRVTEGQRWRRLAAAKQGGHTPAGVVFISASHVNNKPSDIYSRTTKLTAGCCPHPMQEESNCRMGQQTCWRLLGVTARDVCGCVCVCVFFCTGMRHPSGQTLPAGILQQSAVTKISFCFSANVCLHVFVAFKKGV